MYAGPDIRKRILPAYLAIWGLHYTDDTDRGSEQQKSWIFSKKIAKGNKHPENLGEMRLAAK